MSELNMHKLPLIITFKKNNLFEIKKTWIELSLVNHCMWYMYDWLFLPAMLYTVYRPTTPNVAALPPLSQENQDPSVGPGDEPRKFDSTGMFHWCPSRPLIQARMVSAMMVSILGMFSLTLCIDKRVHAVVSLAWLFASLDTEIVIRIKCYSTWSNIKN